MTGWDKEYLYNKNDYLELFDKVMQREQETNIEFLEKSISQKTGRKGKNQGQQNSQVLSRRVINTGQNNLSSFG